MVKLNSPSDFTSINPNYTIGNGHYTTHSDVSNLLQIESFTDYTTPTRAEVGKIIKRVEEKIDDATKHSYRPLIYKNEIATFDFFRERQYPLTRHKDYVGFIQLDYPKVQKILRLEVWQNDEWVDIAGAIAKLKMPSAPQGSSWTIALGVGSYTFNLIKGSTFYDNYGPKTTASQVVDAINEVYPMKTAKFTGETAAKTVTAQGNASVNISDFFYATTDSEASDTVVISSLLLGDDGANNTLTSTFGTVTNFADKEDKSRIRDFWTIDEEGKIFFLNEYPFMQNHSVRTTYVAGDGRVPAPIHEAATKFTAAEVIRHDDNSILIAETQSNIDLKTKHDILLEEANAIVNGKKNIIHFIS